MTTTEAEKCFHKYKHIENHKKHSGNRKNDFNKHQNDNQKY